MMHRIVFLALALAVPACERPTSTGADAGHGGSAVHIVTTTNILADTLRQLVPESFTVDALMGPGIDPHLYRASAGDVRRLQQADVIVYNGLHLEGRMTDVLQGLRGQGGRTIAAGELLPEARLLSHQGGHDPHVWMDVALWRDASLGTARRLAEFYPRFASAITQRAQRWAQQLQQLDAEVRQILAAVPDRQRVLITAHDAFEYFGRAYRFEVMGLMGISTLSETGTNDVRRLADVIVARRIPAIFVESTISDRYLRALQENVASKGQKVRIGGTLYADALGEPGGPAGTYTDMIRCNARTIADALGRTR